MEIEPIFFFTSKDAFDAAVCPMQNKFLKYSSRAVSTAWLLRFRRFTSHDVVVNITVYALHDFKCDSRRRLLKMNELLDGNMTHSYLHHSKKHCMKQSVKAANFTSRNYYNVTMFLNNVQTWIFCV